MTIISNAKIIDVDQGAYVDEAHIVVEGGVIRELSRLQPRMADARRIDVAGATVMPGLIDAHVHVIAHTADFAAIQRQSPFEVAAHASRTLRSMMGRGFTTVRDVGGCDFGLARAVDDGLFIGPRIAFGGKALSPTGGHGDMRGPGEDTIDEAYTVPGLGRRCDGVEAVRAAARDELRRGAHHVKIMANGGVSSPTDRIDSDQFSEAEIAVAVDEAQMANRYVVAHAYTARAITRCVRNGVRSIEHGNLVDEAAIAMMKERGAFLVPTLSTYRALKDEGVAAGLPASLADKIDIVLDAGIRAVEMAYRAGVQMAYGTDLLGTMHRRQLDEFGLRAEVVPPADLLRTATVTGATLLRMEDRLGRIAPGYCADLIAFDGDPLRDIGIMTQLPQRLSLIMKQGVSYAIKTQ
ncbi:MAG: amidohydrolase family protein [Salinarimonas sp.]|nr:amidohydrolase family protein [Salinarimonas sp.]